MICRWVPLALLCFSQLIIADDIRVNVLSLLSPNQAQVDGVSRVTLASAGGVKLLEPKGKPVELSMDGGSGTVQVVVGDFSYSTSHLELYSDTAISVTLLSPHPFVRKYTGSLHVDVEGEALRLVLHKDLEELVASAAFSEFGRGEFSIQAYLAGVICVRSYVIHRQQESQNRHYDISDHTGDVYFTGAETLERVMSDIELRAASETIEGLVLTQHDIIVPGFFSAACGGRTFSSRTIWGESDLDSAYVGVECRWCAEVRDLQWSARLKSSDVMQALGLDSSLSSLQWRCHEGWIELTNGIDVIERFASEKLRIAVGRLRGWNVIQSNNFSIIQRGPYLYLEGTGRGHNVGLCQLGAIAMAKTGRGWRAILDFYFPRLQVRQQR